MKKDSKTLLTEFLENLPPTKRKLSPDIAQPMDYQRLIQVSVSLVENQDSLDVGNITSICEQIGGVEYSQMIKNENFQSDFAETILSEINYAKHVIEVYKSL